jgi:predicted PurR-regulated permease PerM
MTGLVSTGELRAVAAIVDELPPSTADSVDVEKPATPIPPMADLPHGAGAFFLAGILLLLLLFALYFTGALVVPVIFAIGLYLTLKPVMRVAGRLRIPRLLAATLIIVTFFGGVGALGFTLSEPAAEWVAKAPDSLRRLESRLFFLKGPIADLQSASKQVENMAESPTTEAQPVTLTGPGLSSRLYTGTTSALIGLGTTIVLLFFFLVSGDLFLRRLVEILPTLRNRRSKSRARSSATFLPTWRRLP